MAVRFDDAFCACCEPQAPLTPALVYNRPGLAALTVRVGTFTSFRQTMLERITREPALRALGTRESTDFGITLLELWAAVGDILTFYDERIANELYLRTVRERDSVLRLARLIDYRLRPGLAATTRLAFTLDNGAKLTVPIGLKVMSVPAQDQQPQFFETVEAIAAEARLNRVAVFGLPLPVNPVGQGRDRALLFERPGVATPGDPIIFFTSSALEQKTIALLDGTAAGDGLVWHPAIQASEWVAAGTFTAKEVRRLRFFGYNAPERFNKYDLETPNLSPVERWKQVKAEDPGYEMSFPATEVTYPLDARYDDLKPGARLLVDIGDGPERLRVVSVTAAEERKAKRLGQLEDNVTHVSITRVIRGAPLLVATMPGQLNVIARSATGASLAMLLEPAGPEASAWMQLQNGIITGGFAAATLTLARIDLFARGLDRGLWHAIKDHAGWSGWFGLGGAITSDASAIAHAALGLRVFVRGLDAALWYRELGSGGWAPWISLGGALLSAPSAVSASPGGTHAFVRGPKHELWFRASAGSGTWSPWKSLGGALASRPVAIVRAGRIDVFARQHDAALWHLAWNGSAWSRWQSLGGQMRDEPAVASSATNRLDVFVRGNDDRLWGRTLTGETWSAWVDLGGAIASSPSAAAPPGSTAIHVVARAANDALVERSLGARWGPWRAHGHGLGEITDRRKTRIFEISAQEFRFREYDYPEEIAGARVVARADQLDGIDKGRTVLLHDEAGAPHTARIAGSMLLPSLEEDGRAHLAIDIAPALPRSLHGDAAVLLGNVAEASHGESQPDEPLGSGDTATPFQRFTLRNKPLTYEPSRKTPRGSAALNVHINGERWREVETLFGRKPDERVYAVRQQDTGETVVQFGDGIEGARLPTGHANVVARYRQGHGLAGRVAAGQLSMLLARPPGLRAVTNPAAAEGGADPETLDQARETAPTTVRTFGRIVSLQDFESLVTASGLVARAHATWVWRGLEKAVHVTVAAQEGAPLSAEALGNLHAALDAARDINHALLLANVSRVPVEMRAKLLLDPAFERDDVVAEARERLLGYFSFARMPFARAIHASDIHAVLHEARGVVAVDLDIFHVRGRADWTAEQYAARGTTPAAVQPHIRLFSARPSTGSAADDPIAHSLFGTVLPSVLPAEQAHVAAPIGDVTLTPIERFD